MLTYFFLRGSEFCEPNMHKFFLLFFCTLTEGLALSSLKRLRAAAIFSSISSPAWRSRSLAYRSTGGEEGAPAEDAAEVEGAADLEGCAAEVEGCAAERPAVAYLAEDAAAEVEDASFTTTTRRGCKNE